MKIKILQKYRYNLQDHPEILSHIKRGADFEVIKEDKESVRLSSCGLIQKPWVLKSELIE
jgi:hypothetical protein